MKKAALLLVGLALALGLLFLAACGEEATPTPTPRPATPTPIPATPTPVASPTPVSTPLPGVTPSPTATPRPATPTPVPATPTPRPPTPTPAPTVKTGTLKIGVVGPMTGGAAPWGIDIKRGTELYAEVLNKEGGVKIGDTVYTIKVSSFDALYTTTGGVAAGKKFVDEEGIKWIVGPIGSSECLGIQQVTEPWRAVSTYAGCWAEGIIAANHPASFRLGISNRERGPVQAGWMQDNMPQVKRVYLIMPDDPSGRDSSAQLAAGYKAVGYHTVLGEEFYARGTTDFYPILTRMLAKNPDLIDMGMTAAADMGLIQKQLWELGYTGPKFGSFTNWEQTLGISGKAAGEKTYSMGFDYAGPLANAEEKAWRQAALDKFKEEPGTWIFASRQTLGIYLQLMKAVGTPDDIKAAVGWWEQNPMAVTELGQDWRLGGKSRYGIQRQIFGDIGFSKYEGSQMIPFSRAASRYEP